jgi:hypothetical protein
VFSCHNQALNKQSEIIFQIGKLLGFIAKLVALAPESGVNMIRLRGVFAHHCGYFSIPLKKNFITRGGFIYFLL